MSSLNLSCFEVGEEGTVEFSFSCRQKQEFHRLQDHQYEEREGG